MEEDNICNVSLCQHRKQQGDKIFCYTHREEWRSLCEKGNLTDKSSDYIIARVLKYFLDNGGA